LSPEDGSGDQAVKEHGIRCQGKKPKQLLQFISECQKKAPAADLSDCILLELLANHITLASICSAKFNFLANHAFSNFDIVRKVPS
jgi:hypothetical protein